MERTRALLRLCFPPQPRHVREALTVEVRADTAVERCARQRQRACLGRAEDEAAERRHRVRRGAVGPHQQGGDANHAEARGNDDEQLSWPKSTQDSNRYAITSAESHGPLHAAR